MRPPSCGTRRLLATFGALLGADLGAAPRDDAIVAAMRLGEEPGYAWITTVTDDARTYTIRGQTTRDGFSRVSMPVINSLRRHLNRDVTDTDIELIFRGNVACVVETDEGWRTPAEVMSQRRGDASRAAIERRKSAAGASRSSATQVAPGAQMKPGTGVAPAAQEVPRSEQVARDTDAMSDVNDRSSATVEAVTVDLGVGFPATRGDNSDAPRRRRAYSNLQLALSRPHEELGVIIASHATLCVDADIVSGTLTELGAQLLLVREGQDALVPRDASGTFRLWLSNGRVTRYELKLRGAIDVASRAGVRRLEVTQTSETVIRSAPVTTLEVPEAARARLGG